MQILDRFPLSGQVVRCERYGSGHINETYRVETGNGTLYILQRINDRIFRDVPGLMANIEKVSQHLKGLGYDRRHNLTIVYSRAGRSFEQDETGFYRVYDFVTDSLCLDKAESPLDFYSSALAFGRFQALLSAFDARSLSETIPDFHNTPVRYAQLREAIEKNAAGRLESAREEIAFALSREKDASALMDALRAGALPLRVTHNDTKLNNVMLDAQTREPLCVIDLDTVMPGLAANDFGDSIRFGASTAAEDEEDLSRVELSLDLFDVYARGFLTACGDRLTDAEKTSLPLGAKLMTLECGIRFLADYLNGDVYFRVRRPEHNLIRCRTQLKLVRRMEENARVLDEIINKYR